MDVRRVDGFAVFGGEQILILFEIPAGGDGDDDFARLGKFVGQWLDDGGDLVGLDGDDDHIGGRHHFQRVVQRAHAEFGGGLLELVVVSGAGDHLAAGDHARVDEALGDGLGHVAISDKTDGDVRGHVSSFQNNASRSPRLRASS